MLRLLSTEAGEQRTEDWRQARAGSVTGTGFQSVLAYSKTKGTELKERADYRMKLVTERITGMPSPEINAAALSWGKEHEDEARIAFEMYMAKMGQNVFVETVGFQQHPELDWVGTSPDGLIGEQGMIEIKCPFNSTVHLMTIIGASQKLAKALLGAEPVAPSLMPDEYYPQVQGNLWTLGRQWCDFISYDPRLPEHLRLYVARIERDEVFIKRLEAETRKFLDEVESSVATLLLTEVEGDSAQQPVEKKAA